MSPTKQTLSQIAGMSPEQALAEIAAMRTIFSNMRKERWSHPLLSEDAKEHAAKYYGAKTDALDIAAAAIVKAHKLQV